MFHVEQFVIEKGGVYIGVGVKPGSPHPLGRIARTTVGLSVF